MLAYQALYRVYRPQTFHDIAGQEHITKTLQNALIKQKFSHAYLFTGPRGTGKTSAAKILAKAINCEHAPCAEPCNACAACKGITEGSIADVVEIDAASNNGVDEIRDIRDKVKYAPSSVRYKVYIIDEVHMLSTGAFNALLKTLEEPPEHVVFILATTEPQKIPLTIISRCQQFDFRRVPSSAITDRLKFVASDQQMEAEDEALRLIAKASEGGMRDALGILDQTAAYGEGKITVRNVLDVTGMASDLVIRELTEALNVGEATRAINKMAALLDQGKDPLRLMQQLIYYYRDLLLYQTSPDLEDILSRPRTDEAFRKQAADIPAGRIYRLIQQLNDGFLEMRRTNHPRIFLEMTIVRICQPERAPRQPALNQAEPGRLEKLEKRVTTLEEKFAGAETEQEAAPPRSGGEKTHPLRRSGDVRISQAKINRLLEAATKEDLQEVRSAWSTVMAKIKSQNVAAHAWLLESRPVAASPGGFVQAFKYDFHCRMVMDKKNSIVAMVEHILQETIHKEKAMYPVPEETWNQLKQAFIRHSNHSKTSAKKKKDAPAADPLVVEAEKLVGSDLLDIKD